MRNLSDFGIGNAQQSIAIENEKYVEVKALNGVQKTIKDVVFYTKDDVDKAIIEFDDGTYTVTAAVAIITKLNDIHELIDGDEWDVQVRFTERTSKKTGRKYMDIF